MMTFDDIIAVAQSAAAATESTILLDVQPGTKGIVLIFALHFPAQVEHLRLGGRLFRFATPVHESIQVEQYIPARQPNGALPTLHAWLIQKLTQERELHPLPFSTN